MNYELDIRIDDQALDLEWLGQAELMMNYCMHSAEMNRQLDYAKQNLDIVKAELDRDIRLNPDKFGIPKITEEVVKNTILLQSKYQEAYKSLIDADYEAEMAKNAVRAFDQRKDALQNMVYLHAQSYFAGPKVPRDLAEKKSQWVKKPEIKRLK